MRRRMWAVVLLLVAAGVVSVVLLVGGMAQLAMTGEAPCLGPVAEVAPVEGKEVSPEYDELMLQVEMVERRVEVLEKR